MYSLTEALEAFGLAVAAGNHWTVFAAISGPNEVKFTLCRRRSIAGGREQFSPIASETRHGETMQTMLFASAVLSQSAERWAMDMGVNAVPA